MIRLAADENFNNDILRGLLRRQADVDVVRIQDAGLAGADDPTVLAWTAAEERILLTHDVTTLIGYAYDRLESGLPMPGVFVVGHDVGLQQAIEDLLLVAACSQQDEWSGQVRFLPLR